MNTQDLRYTITVRKSENQSFGKDTYEGFVELEYDGRQLRVASVYFRASENQAREELENYVKLDKLTRTLYCGCCNIPIDLEENGCCATCRDQAEADHYEELAEQAYMYPSESQLISVYAQNARNYR